MNDTIRNGMIAGSLGSAGDFIIHWICHVIFGTSTTAHYISQLIFPFKETTITRLAFGTVTHFFAGAIVGVFLVLILKYFGPDYPYYKGIGVAITLWIIHVAVVPNIVSPRPFLHRTESEVLVDFVAHIAYGVIGTIYLVRTFKREPVKK